MAQFTKIEGDISLFTDDGGSLAVHVAGVRVPDGAVEIGKYFGGKIAEQLSGLTEKGVEGVKAQVAKLEKTLANKDAEIVALEGDLKEARKATATKRNTPKG